MTKPKVLHARCKCYYDVWRSVSICDNLWRSVIGLESWTHCSGELASLAKIELRLSLVCGLCTLFSPNITQSIQYWQSIHVNPQDKIYLLEQAAQPLAMKQTFAMPAVVALNVEAEGPHLQTRSGEMRRDAWIGEWVINLMIFIGDAIFRCLLYCSYRYSICISYSWPSPKITTA